nr:MAG TPA: hypothetical protein [Caudoviricetes sp.]
MRSKGQRPGVPGWNDVDCRKFRMKVETADCRLKMPDFCFFFRGVFMIFD